MTPVMPDMKVVQRLAKITGSFITADTLSAVFLLPGGVRLKRDFSEGFLLSNKSLWET